MSALFAGISGKALAVALVLLAAGGLTIGAASLIYKAAASVQAMTIKPRRSATVAHQQCLAQIAQSNSEANARIAAQSRAIVQVQAEATDKIAEIERDGRQRGKTMKAYRMAVLAASTLLISPAHPLKSRSRISLSARSMSAPICRR